MHDPHSKADLIERLQEVQRSLTADVEAMSDQQFNTGTAESWSAADYLKHLILSVKPFVKAMSLPPHKMGSLFGMADRPSVSYSELAAKYTARLAEGIRAEDFDRVTPNGYRMPEDVTDEKAYLVETWNDSNTRLFDALQNWQEEDLDQYQLPHPAVGLLTLREMLFFTLHHNTLHWQDIQQAAANAGQRV